MDRRSLGRTGLAVSVLGFGAGSIGGGELDGSEAGRLLNGVVDLGINLVDTARGYGLSEERIGRHLAHRRREVVLSTKIGYGIPGVPDWSGECIRTGVDAALSRLRTDSIDIVHLHSCPVETLRRDEVIEALARAVEAGKVRVAAYSGENDALAHAIDAGTFGIVQTSVNVCDQRGLSLHVSRARSLGLGVIGKRPLANAPWARTEPPPNDDAAAAYFARFRAMKLDPGDHGWRDRALRFAAFAPGVDSVIAGSRRLEHVAANVESVSRGPLGADESAAIRRAFEGADDGWLGRI